MSSGALKKKNAVEFAYLAVDSLLPTHFYLLVTPWIASRCSQRRHFPSPECFALPVTTTPPSLRGAVRRRGNPLLH
jgi:hypothetical protein